MIFHEMSRLYQDWTSFQISDPSISLIKSLRTHWHSEIIQFWTESSPKIPNYSWFKWIKINNFILEFLFVELVGNTISSWVFIFHLPFFEFFETFALEIREFKKANATTVFCVVIGTSGKRFHFPKFDRHFLFFLRSNPKITLNPARGRTFTNFESIALQEMLPYALFFSSLILLLGETFFRKEAPNKKGSGYEMLVFCSRKRAKQALYSW